LKLEIFVLIHLENNATAVHELIPYLLEILKFPLQNTSQILWNTTQSDQLDPDPHQGDKLDPDTDPHQFADNKPKCMEYEPIYLSSRFEPLFGS
jgi:hypothetical protein